MKNEKQSSFHSESKNKQIDFYDNQNVTKRYASQWTCFFLCSNFCGLTNKKYFVFHFLAAPFRMDYFPYVCLLIYPSSLFFYASNDFYFRSEFWEDNNVCGIFKCYLWMLLKLGIRKFANFRKNSIELK